MAIRRKGSKWEVDVAYSKALPAYRRVRKTVDTREEGEELLPIILAALKEYGKWPVSSDDRPLPKKDGKGQEVSKKFGTLRTAAELTLKYRYTGTSYGAVVEKIIWPMVHWFENRGCLDIDDIKTQDVEEFIDWRRELQNNPGTINKYLSLLSVINDYALERKPPLCRYKVSFKRQKGKHVEKWWLRPEKLDELTKWLELNGEALYADFVRIICFMGLRTEEALRLEARHFIGLHGEEPSVQVPGTKTKKSGNTIPVFDLAIPVVVRSIERAQRGGWSKLFPFNMRRARETWNDCREYLGVADLPSSTQKALRRTFGAYATARGMPTKTLQEIYRHETITTTEGYLDLIGNNRVEDARRFMKSEVKKEEPKAAPTGLAEVILAYKSTGATPEEIARLVKEMMT